MTSVETPQDQVLARYRTRMDELTAATVDAAQSLYEQWDGGEISTDTVVLLIVALINRANATATAYADDYLSLQISVQAGEIVPPVGVPAIDGSARLADAVATVLDDDSPAADTSQQDSDGSESARTVTTPGTAETPAETRATGAKRSNPRLTRLAQSEPWESAQQATSTAMQKQPLVEGWVRELNEGACQLCVFFFAKGRIYPASAPFKRHPNCQCTQKVVLVPAGTIKPLNERKRNR